MELIKSFCGWIYHFSISRTLAVLQGQKSLPDIGGTTVQDVGQHLTVMRAAMEPGVHTMSDELILQISWNIFLAFKWILVMTSGQTISHYTTAKLSVYVWNHDLIWYYSTGVQIVSCTLSDDSVLSESTGLFNPVLCVSQWNLFWQKNQPMRLCLSNQVRSAREWFPSPLGDFIRLFEGLIGELFQIWHWNMFYFFKWHQSGP